MSADDRAVQDALFAKFKDEAKLLYTLSQASLHIVRSMDFGAVTTADRRMGPVHGPRMARGPLARRGPVAAAPERHARAARSTRRSRCSSPRPRASASRTTGASRIATSSLRTSSSSTRTRGRRVKVLDFGIAKIIRDGEGPGTRSPFASFTWLYAAPEQLDPRIGQTGLATDVYSFALLLSELLTDRVPTEGRDVVSLLKAATDPTVRPTPRQRGANVPDAIEVACRRALAVDPKVRYATIPELWAALSAARRPTMPPSVVSSGARARRSRRPRPTSDRRASCLRRSRTRRHRRRRSRRSRPRSRRTRRRTTRGSSAASGAYPPGAYPPGVPGRSQGATYPSAGYAPDARDAAGLARSRAALHGRRDVAASDVAASGHADVPAASLRSPGPVGAADRARGDRPRARRDVLSHVRRRASRLLIARAQSRAGASSPRSSVSRISSGMRSSLFDASMHASRVKPSATSVSSRRIR